MVGNLSWAGLNFIFHEVKQADKTGSDSSKYGCTLKKIYGIPCACLIAKKMKVTTFICMGEIYTHWKRLWFDDDNAMKGDKSNISIMNEWRVIQERFMKVDDNMKFNIKEQLRKIAYPEITDLKPPLESVKTKGSPC